MASNESGFAADHGDGTGGNEEERAIHEGFMKEALAMAELALATDETPVGCVFVHNGKIIGRGMNATNRTLNGTRHAEFMAIASILADTASSASPLPNNSPSSSSNDPTRASASSASPLSNASSTPPSSNDPTQASASPPQLDSAPAPSRPPKLYNPSILQECVLYVTIEPCIMCASLLRQYGIQKVYFGAQNERFGGTGGVLSIHQGPGVEKGYEVSGGWLREEAILLLRRFYLQENGKAPEPRSKKKRKLKTKVEPIV